MEDMHSQAIDEERHLSRLAEIATSLCSTPIAFVSVLSEHEMEFRARRGFDIERIPRQASFCLSVEIETGLVVVNDLRLDPRTCDNPLIAEKGVQFYAGHPIMSRQGSLLGTVCVLDIAPRPQGLSAAEAMGLEALAEQAATIMQLREDAKRHCSAAETHRALRADDTRRIARLTALVHLGDHLRNVGDERDAMAIAGETLGIALDADQSGYVDVDEISARLDVVQEWHRPEVPTASGSYALDDYRDVVDEMQGGKVCTAIDSVPGRPGRYAYLRAPVLLHGRLEGFMYAIDREGRHWSQEDHDFAHGVADRLHETVMRLRSEQEREILIGETAHRLKNVMAVTRAIVMQTLSGKVGNDVSITIDERLSAYSAAHDLLLRGSANEASYMSTVESVLERLSLTDRVAITGRDPVLNERTTLALSLLVNELATNALKHGSLSRREGMVEMACALENGELVVTWHEKGGPPASPPRRQGFGSRILQIGFNRRGGTTLDYAVDGLKARFCRYSVAA